MQFDAEHVETRTQFDDFTLIVPTYNRPELLAKLLKFYSFRLPNILVLDSSNEQNVALNKSAIKRLSSGIVHRIYDSKIAVARKLLSGLDEIKTKYYAFCADDDLIFVKSLHQALNYLHTHVDCVGVDGLYFSFDSTKNGIRIGIEYSGVGISSEHPIARVSQLMGNYESRFYGVYRTKDAIKVFQRLVTLESLHFQELFQSNAFLLIGKVHRLPIFYAARSQGKPADDERENWQTYYWFASDPQEFVRHYLTYRNILLTHYQDLIISQGVSTDIFNLCMDLVHSSFFSKNCPHDYFLNEIYGKCSIDSTKEINGLSVLQQFKGLNRRRWELAISHFVSLFEKGMTSLYSPWHLFALNRHTKKQFGSEFNCILAKRLAWISGHREFRHSYLDLCEYLKG